MESIPEARAVRVPHAIIGVFRGGHEHLGVAISEELALRCREEAEGWGLYEYVEITPTQFYDDFTTWKGHEDMRHPGDIAPTPELLEAAEDAVRLLESGADAGRDEVDTLRDAVRKERRRGRVN